MRTLVVSLILFGWVNGQNFVPKTLSLKETALRDSTKSGLQSNVIVEIRTQSDKFVWLGTGRGLTILRDSTTSRTFYSSTSLKHHVESLFLPEGGVSAIGVGSSDTVLVAIATSVKGVSTGGGLSFSTNSHDTTGVNWMYFSQPVDSSGDSSLVWGGDTLKALPVTVPQQNVTFDIAISNNYYWIVSWAGGLRRLNRGGNLSEAEWERVPLPMDEMSEMNCGDEIENYQLNPRDPPDGNHNHKGFSVLAYGDTVWVGTANGINRGILNGSGCIDWQHYTYPLSGITGNWVVGMAKQEVDGKRIIWAVTLRADQPGEVHGISYTPDDGLTWLSVPILQNERGYNIFSTDSLVYVATENGLWRSEDGINFALYRPAIDAANNDQILDNNVYAVVHDKRSYWDGTLWVGTGDGLARTPDPGSNESIWTIYRTNISPKKIYAYPNPFSPRVHNLLDGDGYARFHIPTTGLKRLRKSNLIKVSIYNFAMEEVRIINHRLGKGNGTLKWDGKDSRGSLVANGVYFCKVLYDDEDHWIKLMVVK